MAATMSTQGSGYINHQNWSRLLAAQVSTGSTVSAQVADALASVSTNTSVSAQDEDALSSRIQVFMDLPAVSEEDLWHLNELLDRECLRYTTNIELRPDKGLTNQSLAVLTRKLCSPLEDFLDERSPAYAGIQLRTLVATLALLHLRKVSGIRFEIYDEIRNEKLGRLYGIICQHHKDGGHPITATNVYLIQLALQYFARFRCVINRAYETTEPILDIAFASVPLATQQAPNARAIYDGVRKLALIWKKSEPTHHPICTLQEHVRQTTRIMRAYNSLNHLTFEDATLLAETLNQVEKVFEIEFPQNPDTLSDWHMSRNAFQLGPPGIKTNYYFYGLLDCTAQLSTFVSLQKVKPKLFKRILDFTCTTNVSVYRWKAAEILLSCKADRPRVFPGLNYRVTHLRPREPDTVGQIHKHIELVLEMLQDDENRGLRPCIDAPVRQLPKVSDSNDSDDERSQLSTDRRWQEGRVQHFRAVQTGHLLVDTSSDLKQYIKKGCHSVGFSSHCENLFFYSTKKVCIFGLRRPSHPHFIVGERLDKRQPSEITVVASTQSYLVFGIYDGTTHFLIGYDLSRTEGSCQSLRLDGRHRDFQFSAGDRRPKALEAFETPEYLCVLLAQANGTINVYISPSRRAVSGWYPTAPSLKLEVPENDFAKVLSLSTQHDCVAALTHRNKLFIWKFVNDQKEFAEPFEYRHGYYNPDIGDNAMKDRGLTSVSLYSPKASQNTYAVCASFPSRSRYDSKGNWEQPGEWSYVTPVSFPPDRRPPLSLVDNLTQFNQNYGGLTNGCVSNTANVLAVLEKCSGEKRRVRVLSLQAHEQGGVHCPENIPILLENVTLTGRDEAHPRTPCTIKFDAGGRRLFAADFEGKIYVVDFVQS